MDINRAIKIINSPFEASSPEEEIKAYKTFFKEFNVNIKNEYGKYKSLYDIFKEAGHNYEKTKIEAQSQQTTE